MPTLHIETPITDLATFRAAFERLADVRRRAGVRAERVQQPIDDSGCVVVDLEFDTAEEGKAFLSFLETNVWDNRENAPAQAGPARAMILAPVMP